MGTNFVGNEHVAKTFLFALIVVVTLLSKTIVECVYILNRTGSRLFPGQRLLSNGFSNDSVEHIKVFRSDSYVHVSKALRSKFDPKSVLRSFIGSCPTSKAYCLWNHDKKKVVVNRDVIFMSNVYIRTRDYINRLLLEDSSAVSLVAQSIPPSFSAEDVISPPDSEPMLPLLLLPLHQFLARLQIFLLLPLITSFLLSQHPSVIFHLLVLQIHLFIHRFACSA